MTTRLSRPRDCQRNFEAGLKCWPLAAAKGAADYSSYDARRIAGRYRATHGPT